MKKLLAVLVFLALIPAHAFAAGSITYVYTPVNSWLSSLTFTWTAATGGAVTAKAGPAIDGMVILVETNPGSTAPTDNYDLTLTDSGGADVMGGSLANRDSTTTERAMPLQNGNYTGVPVHGPLTLNISGNSVSAATGTVTVYFAR